MKFDAVFSLGANCVPAAQIRRFFGRAPQSPFDWLVTPMDSVVKIFGDDGKGLCRQLSTSFNGMAAYCESYGVHYYHEFERTAEGKVIFTEETIRQGGSKLTYKYSKLLDISRNSRTLFIRYLSGTDIPSDRLGNKTPLSPLDVSALLMLLERKLGHTNFHLALFKSHGFEYDLIGEELFSSMPKVSVHAEQFQGGGILGEDSAWDQFFNQMGFMRHDQPLGTSSAQERSPEI